MPGSSGLCRLRTNSCCCGISLRTGTIIILILNLIGGLSVSVIFRIITRYNPGFWVAKIVFNGVEVFALFGVFKKKAAYLVPHLVVAAIFLIAFSLIIIGNIIMIPFSEKLLAEVTYETSDGKSEHLFVKDTFYVMYAGFTIASISKFRTTLEDRVKHLHSCSKLLCGIEDSPFLCQFTSNDWFRCLICPSC